MYSFFNQYKKGIKCVVLVVTITITGLLFYFTPVVFKEPNVFFYTSSTIIQGFISLAALLGVVVVFKVQLEDQAMQKLSDGAQQFVRYYRGLEADIYTPTQMMIACKEILDNEPGPGNKANIERVYKKMVETLASRNEARNKLVDFSVISFFNIAVAMIMLLFTPVFAKDWYVAGGMLLSANVYLSIFSLYKALYVVRSTMGYDFSKN